MQYPYGCDLHVCDETFYTVSCKCILDVYKTIKFTFTHMTMV